MGFSIKELESLSGIKAHTIRIWEQRYNFLKPSRTQTNIRTYSNEELQTLLTVALLNKYGHKISRIDGMSSEQRVNEVLQISDTEAQNEKLVNDLIGCMIELKVEEFEGILNRYISKHGIETSIVTIIFQFLNKVGILWQTNRINPAHEHIVSNIVRQKLISGIEKLPFPSRKENLFILFLPEDEFHELGLLFVYFLLRKSHIPVIYLGANVPLKDVEYVVQKKYPSYLYIHLTSFPSNQSFQKFLQKISPKDSKLQLLISGGVTDSYKYPLPQNVSFLKSFPEVLTYIQSL